MVRPVWHEVTHIYMLKYVRGGFYAAGPAGALADRALVPTCAGAPVTFPGYDSTLSEQAVNLQTQCNLAGRSLSVKIRV